MYICLNDFTKFMVPPVFEITELKRKIMDAKRRHEERKEAKRKLQAMNLYAEAIDRKNAIDGKIKEGVENRRNTAAILKLSLGVAASLLISYLAIAWCLPLAKVQKMSLAGKASSSTERVEASEMEMAERLIAKAFYGNPKAGSYLLNIWSPKAIKEHIGNGDAILDQLRRAPYKLFSVSADKESGYRLLHCDFGRLGRHCLLAEKFGDGMLLLSVDGGEGSE